MKEKILVLFLMVAFSMFGQKKIAEQVNALQNLKTDFQKVSVLIPNTTINNSEVKKVVNDATLAKADLETINRIVAQKNEYIELEIPYQNQLISVLLYKVDPLVEDFRVDTDVQKNISYQKGIHYRGIIKNDLHSVSSFNFFNDEFNGIISNGTLGNLVVGKLDKKENKTDYIVYSDAKMNILNQWQCSVEDQGFIQDNNGSINRETNITKCVSFYFEIDNDIFIQNGSNTMTTINWMISVFSNVQTLFDNDGISTTLKSIFVWTNPDIYDGSGTTSTPYLYAFYENRPVFNGDVGMLVGIDYGNLGGVAFRDSICTFYNHSYSDVEFSFNEVPVFSWTVNVIAHELGHSLGSPHTHGCYWNGNGTAIDGCGAQAGYPEGNCPTGPIPSASDRGVIMSYCHLISGVGISFANGFGTQPAALIRNIVNGKSCLNSSCTNICINTIDNFMASSITENSAVVSWNDVSTTASSWQVSFGLFGADETWDTVGSMSFLVSDLQPNTYYEAKIKPACANSATVTKTIIFATAANYCAGITFTDTGGTLGDYSNNETVVRTMIPNLPGQKLTANFTLFSLEAGYDFLYIYDGSDTTYPELNFGDGFTGDNSPGTITSTAADGSLTFEFVSDIYVTEAGWIATISCQPDLGVSANDFIDFSYYPNPTNGMLNIKSNTIISEITAFNIEGRKLFHQNTETLESTVDISQFAIGTYFFKLKFGEKEANFKVLKM